MSEKGLPSKTTREERLAAQLRANLRRRKQALRKAKAAPKQGEIENDPTPDVSLP